MSERPASKEALPVRGRPLIEHLLARFHAAGIERVAVVLRQGKDDVAELVAAQTLTDVEVVWTEATPGVPHTLAQARKLLLDRRVALGFPDILFDPLDAFAALEARQRETGADVVLGLYRTDRPGATDMVELDAKGRPRAIVIKDSACTLTYTWQIALWTPRFTSYLLNVVADEGGQRRSELQVGDVLRNFIERGEGGRLCQFRWPPVDRCRHRGHPASGRPVAFRLIPRGWDASSLGGFLASAAPFRGVSKEMSCAAADALSDCRVGGRFESIRKCRRWRLASGSVEGQSSA